jgi:hypothetical protein
MSFLTDLFEGHTSNLGTDLSHAGSSLLSHPSELYETLGGAAALATGGLALGGLAGAGGLFGAADAGLGAADAAGVGAATADASAFTGAADASAFAGAPGIQAIDAAAGGASSIIGSPAAVDAAGAAVDPLAASGGAAGGATPLGQATTDADMFGITGTGGAAPAAAPAATPPAGSSFLSTLTDPSQWTLPGVGKVAGVAAAGAGLGMNLLNRGQTDPNQAMLAQQAAQLGQSGQVLESYLKTGKLPPALQAQLDQAVAAEKARIVSGYAAKGMPTDPNQNSALAQDLNNVQTNAIAAMANVQVEMMNTGLKETGLSSQLYQMLTQLDLQQNKDLMSAISSFAAALGGGMGGGQNVKLSLA